MLTPEFWGEAGIAMAIIAALFGVFAVGGIIADHVLPRIPALQHWMNSLDLFPGDNFEEE